MSSGDSQTVYVVDDDPQIRTMLSAMIAECEGRATGFQPHPFAGASDFLEATEFLKPGCILLDLRMPGMDGFEVMAELRRRDLDWPVIVMTGASDVANAVQAMKSGAMDFLEKPIRLQALEEALGTAAEQLVERSEAAERRRTARERISQLSAREQDVLNGLMAGQSNKELAQSLGIGLRTVEMHRGKMMERLGVGSVGQAVALALEAGMRAPH